MYTYRYTKHCNTLDNFIPYRWRDISNVINHKKTFRIECQLEGEEAKQFVFTESRNAKYIWRLCIAQHTFYMQYQENRSLERTNGYFVRITKCFMLQHQFSCYN